MDHYENDFEAAMLKDTSAYYSRKASNWILEDSCPDYMLKVLFLCGDYIDWFIHLQYCICLASVSYCVFHYRLRNA